MIDLKSLSETSNGLVFSTARIIQRRETLKQTLHHALGKLRERSYSKARLIRIRLDRSFYPVWAKIRINRGLLYCGCEIALKKRQSFVTQTSLIAGFDPDRKV